MNRAADCLGLARKRACLCAVV